MLSRCCIFHPEDSDPLLRMKFTACRKLPWCAGRLQYRAHYRYPQSFPQSAAAVIACSHYQSPIVKYGTVERSDLAKCRQDELCCRRTIRRWNPEARGFRLMYGTPTADEKKFIHTPVSTKSSVSFGSGATRAAQGCARLCLLQKQMNSRLLEYLRDAR